MGKGYVFDGELPLNNNTNAMKDIMQKLRASGSVKSQDFSDQLDIYLYEAAQVCTGMRAGETTAKLEAVE